MPCSVVTRAVGEPTVATAAMTSAHDRCEWVIAGWRSRTVRRTAATDAGMPCSGPTAPVCTVAPMARSRSASGPAGQSTTTW